MNNQENKQAMNIQIAQRDKPMFAHDVWVETNITASNNKDSKLANHKVATMRLTFTDTTRGQTVADIVITSITAEALKNLLEKQIESLVDSLKTGKPLKTEKIVTKTSDYSYIG